MAGSWDKQSATKEAVLAHQDMHLPALFCLVWPQCRCLVPSAATVILGRVRRLLFKRVWICEAFSWSCQCALPISLAELPPCSLMHTTSTCSTTLASDVQVCFSSRSFLGTCVILLLHFARLSGTLRLETYYSCLCTSLEDHILVALQMYLLSRNSTARENTEMSINSLVCNSFCKLKLCLLQPPRH